VIKVRVERAWDINGFNIWIMDYDPYKKTGHCAQQIDLIFKPMEENWKLPDPTLRLEASPRGNGEEILRAIAEGIMEAGLIPRITNDNLEQVKAMEANLKDLREIVKPLMTRVLVNPVGNLNNQ
jgi:hypothetical protein